MQLTCGKLLPIAAVLQAILAVSYAMGNISCAYACTCIQPDSPQEAFDTADAVFFGRIIEKHDDGNDIRYAFDVDRVWKGEKVHENVVVYTISEKRGLCGTFSANEGERYLVYAYQQDAYFSVNLCSMNEAIPAAQAELQALGEGYAPVAGGDSLVMQEEKWSSFWKEASSFPLIVGIGAAIAGIVAFLALRKRK
jgi:hypothetical protein